MGLNPNLARAISNRNKLYGEYIRHGNYVMMFNNSLNKSSWMINEFFVVESYQRFDLLEEPNSIYAKCSHSINMEGLEKDYAAKELQDITLALFGLDSNQISESKLEETLTDMYSDKQPARAMLISVSTWVRSNQKNEARTGKIYKCISKPSEGVNMKELVAARLEALARGPEDAVKLAIEHLTAFRK